MNDVRPMRPLDDDALVAGLRDLAPALDWPADRPAGADVATRVAVALRSAPPPARIPRWRPVAPRRLGRGRVLALVALLALAAVAGAMVLGLPGLRLGRGDPGTRPTVAPSATRPTHEILGVGLNLGEPVADRAAAAARVGRPIELPADPRLGEPDTVYVDEAKADAVALVWAARDDLPASLEPGIGLILMSFDGTIEEELYLKMLARGTGVERVDVKGHPGIWISGDPHVFFFQGADGRFIDDGRRWVGDAVAWSDGTTTWRLETSLGRDAAIQLAESLP